ncbi:MAG: hypothetical protein VX932_05165 [Candidatus Neomarinimicrobiota bacterium]|nr:hypothetical protein [Candidatus Neomarinimicrobiota bacterium]MEC9448648.1 hypothetical protein [Candidatus Neomarinimicrobiota bacterium]|tara:strand:+ start:124 stop:567 length:444 start_codon:yes stop_codon:yes gene_type:complete
MKIRSDINARTALVYGGAAFLLVIVGFRSIFATLDPDHVGLMTYLSIGALILEFCLLILYAQSIYNLGEDDGHSQASGGDAAKAVSNMDKDAVASLASAVNGLKTELKGHNERMEALSSGVTRLVKGTVQKEIHSEVSRILTKAIKQ